MSTASPIFMRPPRELSPDTLAALQAAVARCGNQKLAAAELGVSAALVCNALKGKYLGDIAGLEQRIRGALMKATVTCPVLGELSTKSCLDEQRRKPVFTNPVRVRLARACKTCPNRKDSTTTGGPKC